jgi:hypothetical protein
MLSNKRPSLSDASPSLLWHLQSPQTWHAQNLTNRQLRQLYPQDLFEMG